MVISVNRVISSGLSKLSHYRTSKQQRHQHVAQEKAFNHGLTQDIFDMHSQMNLLDALIAFKDTDCIQTMHKLHSEKNA